MNALRRLALAWLLTSALVACGGGDDCDDQDEGTKTIPARPASAATY